MADKQNDAQEGSPSASEEKAGDAQATGEEGHEEEPPKDDAEKTGDQSSSGGSGETSGQSTDSKKGPVEIPDDFFYNVEEHWSKPFKSDPEQSDYLVTLYHSFGYQCRMRHNLHALNQQRLMFSAGCFLQVIHMGSSDITYEYFQTTGGGSIGALAVHPGGELFAVGEKGVNPDVNIYTTDDFRLYRILRKGTTAAYNSVCFNNEGDLLASQGAEPDFMLTVWNWKQEAILLRCRSFSQEVNHVSFNRDLCGALTTAGSGHIKFWNMARTFTGLKLQGQVGRFGRTPITDIEGYIEFPDGKVLSGSDWGNMLLWDERLIKLEVGRRTGKKCHNGQIMHMMIVEGEIITAGTDGFVRSWNVELIDMLEAAEESGLVEIDAMNEVLIDQDVSLYHLTRPIRVNKAKAATGEEGAQEEEEEEGSAEDESRRYIWFCQDGAGGIWEADLSFSMAAVPPKRLLSFHAGAIVACVVSPKTYLVMTLGEDGSLRLYDFLKRQPLAVKEFKAKGSSLVWIPVCVDDKFNAVMAGFSDGGIRKVIIDGTTTTVFGVPHLECQLRLTKALRPHSQAVTGIAYSHGNIQHCQATLVTCSEDRTIFFFEVQPEDRYVPFCFVPLEHVPRHVVWSPDENSADHVMITCDDGCVIELIKPQVVDHTDTYEYKLARMRVFQFTSVKSEILHQEELDRQAEEEEKQEKERESNNKMLLVKGLETPSQQQLRIESENAAMAAERKAKEEELEQWKPYIPPIPSPILQTLYMGEDSSFWLTLGGYDEGFFYECRFNNPFLVMACKEGEEGQTLVDRTPPLRATRLEAAEDASVTAMCFSAEGQEVFLGMKDGRIRVQFLDEEFDLSSQRGHWTMGAHDLQLGAITGLKLSHDEAFLISVGNDGNFFIFNLEPVPDILERNVKHEAEVPAGSPEEKSVEDFGPSTYTIELAKQKKDYDHMVHMAEKCKQEKRVEIAALRTKFTRLVSSNHSLPPRHRLTPDEFVMHPCFAEEMERQKQLKVEELRKQMAWESEKVNLGYQKMYNHFRGSVCTDRFCVRALGTEHVIWSYRLDKMLLRKMTVMERGHTLQPQFGEEDTSSKLEDEEEELFKQMLGSVMSMGAFTASSKRTCYLLKKVVEKKRKRARRQVAWRRFLDTKPTDDFEDPQDVEAIQEAKDTLGHRVLKTDKNYIVPDSYKLTMADGSKRLLSCETKLYRMQNDFNNDLLDLREFKQTTVAEIQHYTTRLQMVQDRLFQLDVKSIPIKPRLTLDEIPGGRFKLDASQEQRLRQEVHELRQQRLSETERLSRTSAFAQKSRRKSSVAIAKESLDRWMTRKSQDFSGHVTSPALRRFVHGPDVFVSPLITELRSIEQVELTNEQSVLLKLIKEKTDQFNIRHRQLRHDKFELDMVVKVGQLRVMTLNEELQLLKDCEHTEMEIQQRIDANLEQKAESERMIKQLQTQASKQAKELEELGKKDKALLAKLESIIGDSNPFHDYLVKVFKKKVKRKSATKKEDGDDEDSSESDSDSSDSSEESDEEDEDAIHYDVNVCPANCSEEIYQKVVELREDRVDQDEATAEVKRLRDALLKDVEALVKKRQATEQTFTKAQKELAAFQLEKQHRVNDLDTVYAIHLHQIQCLRRNGELGGLSDDVILDETEVNRLRSRITELKVETKDERKKTDQRRKLYATLRHEKNNFLDRLAATEELCKKEMVKKFGRIVDMEVVESVIADPQLEDVKARLYSLQHACDAELKQADQQIKDMKKRNIESLRVDTDYKQVETEMRTRKMELEKQLNANVDMRRMRYEDDHVPIPNDILELRDVVEEQRAIIAALLSEIKCLQDGVAPPK